MERTEFRKAITVLVILLLFAPIVLFSSLSVNTHPSSSAQLLLPEVLGNWKKVRNIPIEDRVITILGTDDVVGGVYEDPGKNIIKVIIVQAVNNRSAFHPPEYCLTGAGSEIVEKRTKYLTAVPGIDGKFSVNEMVFKSADKQSLLVWNWYAVGRSMTPNFYSQQWKLVTARFRFGKADGAAVNMYTDIKEADVNASDTLNTDFVRSLVPFLNSNL